MSRRKNHYQLLAVEPDATASEIKRAYRELAKTYHPDLGHVTKSQAQKNHEHEHMMRLNEAYQVLIDKKKRAIYDSQIGITKVRVTYVQVSTALEEDAAHESYLREIYYPSRQAMNRVLGLYKAQLRELSQDIYDASLLETFEEYVNRLEDVLLGCSKSYSSRPVPESLMAAVNMMRHALGQASDGLDELKNFCQNFDYDHLSMAGNLFKIAAELSKESNKLIRVKSHFK
jgi:molecular chaperone DnaJ